MKNPGPASEGSWSALAAAMNSSTALCQMSEVKQRQTQVWSMGTPDGERLWEGLTQEVTTDNCSWGRAPQTDAGSTTVPVSVNAWAGGQDALPACTCGPGSGDWNDNENGRTQDRKTASIQPTEGLFRSFNAHSVYRSL